MPSAPAPPARHTRAIAAALTCALATCAWQACSIYDTSLLVAASSDASIADGAIESDAPITPPGSDADTCTHAGWPARPAADDPSTTPEVRVVNALRTMDIGQRPDGGVAPPFGFDLDGVCTCPGLETCTPTKGSSAHCDESHGLDNAGGALLKAFSTFKIFDQDTINDRLLHGFYGLVIHVRGYNGQANDTRVTLAVYVSFGVDGVQDGGSPEPKLDGTDHWTIDPASLLGGKNVIGQDCGTNEAACAPLYFDESAYVANHVLVGHIDFPLTLGSAAHFGMVTMDLTGSVVTATLVPATSADGDTFRLDTGTVAGRWATSKLLASLAVLKDPLSTSFLCGDNPTYQGIKTRICSEADITSDGKLDRTSSPCDALSVGFGFTSLPARFGQVFSAEAPPFGCMSDAGSKFEDRCP